MVFFAFFVALAAEGQASIAEWYSLAPESRPYDSIRVELEAVDRIASERLIPEELVLARVREGAGKKIQPTKLLAAIRQDLVLYSEVLDALVRVDRNPGSKAEEIAFLEKGAMALRSGIGLGSLSAVLGRASSTGTDRILDALVAVGAILPRMVIEAGDAEALALALALGPESTGKFSMLSSLFLRGRAGGLTAHDLVTISVTIFGARGTFLQLENEIARRTK